MSKIFLKSEPSQEKFFNIYQIGIVKRKPYLINSKSYIKSIYLPILSINNIHCLYYILLFLLYSDMRVDHIAIAVNDADRALENYKKILKIDNIDVEEVPNEKVKVVMLNLEDTRLELIEPLEDTSPISKFLKERGEGIHHIAITADEIENDVNQAKANGMRFLGELRTGSYGRKITFIHPKSLNGVLVEFCQAPPH